MFLKYERSVYYSRIAITTNGFVRFMIGLKRSKSHLSKRRNYFPVSQPSLLKIHSTLMDPVNVFSQTDFCNFKSLITSPKDLSHTGFMKCKFRIPFSDVKEIFRIRTAGESLTQFQTFLVKKKEVNNVPLNLLLSLSSLTEPQIFFPWHQSCKLSLVLSQRNLMQGQWLSLGVHQSNSVLSLHL